MTVKELSNILGDIPCEFEVRVIGLFTRPAILDHLEVLDIQVSYKNKMVLIFPKYPAEKTSTVD